MTLKTIPEKLMADPIHPNRNFYMEMIPIDEIKKDIKYLVRSLDDKHKNDLKTKIQDQGLIEPITVHREPTGEFVLLAGHHRLVALEELEAKEVPAKIYVNLDESEKRLVGYMSNETRKRPSAGKRYQALNELFDVKMQELRKELGRIPSEQEIISTFYFGSQQMPVKEAILGIIIDKLRNDSSSLVSKYCLIQNAQTPKRKIEGEITYGRYPLMTAQNTFAALMQLCRAKPVTKDEEDEDKNYRKYEYANVKEFFDKIISEFIKPWIEVGQIDTVINFSRRYQFEAFARIVNDLLVEDGLPDTSTYASPFYHQREINWEKLFSKLVPLKDANIWNHQLIATERNISDLKSRLRFFMENGKVPEY